MTAGAVKKKENCRPPLRISSEVIPAPEGPYVGLAKSAAKPVVAPLPSMTLMVQERISLMRTTVVDALVWPIHDINEALVGVPEYRLLSFNGNYVHEILNQPALTRFKEIPNRARKPNKAPNINGMEEAVTWSILFIMI
jgi:hypothetical protein